MKVVECVQIVCKLQVSILHSTFGTHCCLPLHGVGVLGQIVAHLTRTEESVAFWTQTNKLLIYEYKAALDNYYEQKKTEFQAFVAANGTYSDYSIIDPRVPQGSIFGPLLFLIYINDLEKNIKYNIKFFADDTMVFSIIKDPVISADDLNHDLDIIYQWAHQWKMEVNPDSTKLFIQWNCC